MQVEAPSSPAWTSFLTRTPSTSAVALDAAAAHAGDAPPLPMPSNPSALAKDAGVDHFKRGEYIEALQAFEAAVHVDESNWQAWNNLAVVCLSEGKYSDALQAAEASLKVNALGGKAQCLRSISLAELGRQVEALDGLRDTIASTSDPDVRRHARLAQRKVELELALRGAG